MITSNAEFGATSAELTEKAKALRVQATLAALRGETAAAGVLNKTAEAFEKEAYNQGQTEAAQAAGQAASAASAAAYQPSTSLTADQSHTIVTLGLLGIVGFVGYKVMQRRSVPARA